MKYSGACLEALLCFGTLFQENGMHLLYFIYTESSDLWLGY